MGPWQEVVDNIARVLKPAASWSCTTPNDPGQFSVLDEYAGHVRRFGWGGAAVGARRVLDPESVHGAGLPLTRAVHWTYKRVALPLLFKEHAPERMWQDDSLYRRVGAEAAYQLARIDDLFNGLKLGTTWVVKARKLVGPRRDRAFLDTPPGATAPRTPPARRRAPPVRVRLEVGRGHHLHPDERFISMVEEKLSMPDHRSDYFDSTKSSLDPYNRGYGSFVYGTLPVLLAKGVGRLLGKTGYDGTYLVGRALSGLFDLRPAGSPTSSRGASRRSWTRGGTSRRGAPGLLSAGNPALPLLGGGHVPDDVYGLDAARRGALASGRCASENTRRPESPSGSPSPAR